MGGGSSKSPVLNLSGQLRGTKHLKKVCEELANDTIVTTLSLRLNSIVDEGVDHVVYLLNHNHTLTELDLSDNFIDNEGAEKLAKALEGNPSIRSINLQGNPMRPASEELVQSVVIGKEAAHNLKEKRMQDMMEHTPKVRDHIVEETSTSSSCAWRADFDHAMGVVQAMPIRGAMKVPSKEEKQQLTALEMQVERGDAVACQPRPMDSMPDAQARWDVWKGLEGLSAEAAATRYMELLESIAPAWREVVLPEKWQGKRIVLADST